jgi:hypothetical protein
MKRVITIVCMAAALCLSTHHVYAQYGWVLYSGANSADLYMGKLTDPQYTKVEYYRGAKKLGEITMNGPDGGIVTDYGLAKGQPYQYEFRAWKSAGGFLQGLCLQGYLIGGDIRGYLFRKDTIAIRTDLVDSVFIYPGGPINSEISMPGGELTLAAGADVSYNVSMSGKISGIRIFDTNDPKYPPGKFSALGGRLNDVNIECYGQVGPISNITFIASDVNMYSDYPCVMDNCVLEWTTALQRFDHAYFNHRYYGIRANQCTVRNNSEFIGVANASRCTLEYDGIMLATNSDHCTFKDNGQLSMRPANTPTTCRYCTFKGGTSSSSVSISNQSILEYNLFEPGTILTCASQNLFDPKDVTGIHINYNEFQRLGDDAALLSTRDVDTIDARMNYWGQCTGPTNSERIGRTAWFDPFLRVRWPGTSYWWDNAPDKMAIIANGEDSITFTGHFYNVLAGVDSVGATVSYMVRVLGDTVMKGTLTTDANGNASLTIKLPEKYNSAIAMEVYFKSIQCIDQAFYIKVSAAEGPDLEVYEAKIVQTLEAAPAIIARKSYIVKATITTSEGETTPFPVQVRIGSAVYDTFYVHNKNNFSVKFQAKNPMTKISLPKAESPVLYFFINDTTEAPGSLDVEVIIDPPDATHPKGYVLEANENNNSKHAQAVIKQTHWANDNGPKFNVFLQPFDLYPSNLLDKVTRWADTTQYFLQSSWPMEKGQVSFTRAQSVADYSWIEPDTLLAESFEYYLMKSYKQMRLAQPAYDRYVLVVDRDWFATRLHPVDFSHRLSQGLSWSGIYDMALCSSQSYTYLAHGLGHSFGLRRGDFLINDADIQEENMNYFVGKEVYDGWDFDARRLLYTGLDNEVSRRQRAYCFMGNSRLSSEAYEYYTWICDVDYNKLLGVFSSLRGDGGVFKKGPVAKALFVEGSVDSTTKAFSFGPWARMDNAIPSNMVDSAYAFYTFKLYDASNNVVARYFYRPTFTTLGMDEGALAPQVTQEYFAFVVPCPDGVTKATVEKDGTPVITRTVTTNPPAPNVTYPGTDGFNVPEGPSFTAAWTATDPDGDTEFWYTVYLSLDNGVTWKLVRFESKDVEAILKLPKGTNYKLKVIANDGVNSSEQIRVFNVQDAPNDVEGTVATDFVLHQNFPNPFNPSTLLRYSIPVTSHVSVIVYDALGRPVETLYNGPQAAGSYALQFDGANRPSGTYTAVLRAGTHTASIRMLLSR